MYDSFRSQESHLIQAVIDNQPEQVRALLYEEGKNIMGFSALEVAFYLDRRECARLLGDVPVKIFKIQGEGKKIKELDQATFEKFFNLQYVSHLRFCSYDLLKRVAGRPPFLLRFGPLRRAALQLFERFGDKIVAGWVAPSSIRWIDPVLGYGLFAEKGFKTGDFIGEYCGQVNPQTIFNQSLNEYCLLYPKTFPFYSLFIIDAKECRNELPFVNHSYTPNLEMQLALNKGLLHILFSAKRSIAKGEQFTYDYGEDFWSKRGPPLDP